MTDHTQNVFDGALTGALVSSPAWASWLADVNLALTTFTLLLGLVLGLARLWAFLRDRGRPKD